MASRIIFAGTPEHAVPFLEAIADSPYKPIAIITQPDRAQGRGKKVEAPPVKKVAEKFGIPVLQPENINDSFSLQQIRDLDPALMVVIAYGQILKKELLATPTHGCINVHFSLLPRHRGASPVQQAILDGDTETGVAIIQMDEKLDHGPILSQVKVVIEKNETTPSLREKLNKIGAPLLLQTIEKICAGKSTPISQQEEHATYTSRFTREIGHIAWFKNSIEISRQIRALNPWPGTWTMCNEKRIKIIEARAIEGEKNPFDMIGLFHGKTIICGQGLIEPLIIQVEGKRPLSMEEFMRGYHPSQDWKCA